MKYENGYLPRDPAGTSKTSFNALLSIFAYGASLDPGARRERILRHHAIQFFCAIEIYERLTTIELTSFRVQK